MKGDNWQDKRIVTVDLRGKVFLDGVKTGNKVTAREDGSVDIETA